MVLFAVVLYPRFLRLMYTVLSAVACSMVYKPVAMFICFVGHQGWGHLQ